MAQPDVGARREQGGVTVGPGAGDGVLTAVVTQSTKKPAVSTGLKLVPPSPPAAADVRKSSGMKPTFGPVYDSDGICSRPLVENHRFGEAAGLPQDGRLGR